MSDYQAFYSSSHALIIGIDKYDDPRLPELGSAVSDARALADVLSSPPYDFSVSLLINEQATRQNILGDLFKLRYTAQDDRILVYFAGHGYTFIDKFNRERGYIAAVDTVQNQDFTALELNEVTDLTRYAEAKHVAFIFDACFSGHVLGLSRTPPATDTNKFLTRRAFQVITAGAGNETVADTHSMTSFLIPVLTDRPGDFQSVIQWSQLGIYLRSRITLDKTKTQIPQFGHLEGSQGGEFVLYLDTSLHLPNEVVHALESSSPRLQVAGVQMLLELARGDSPEHAALARARLDSLRDHPDQEVRDLIDTFFNPKPPPPEPEPVEEPPLAPEAPPAAAPWAEPAQPFPPTLTGGKRSILLPLIAAIVVLVAIAAVALYNVWQTGNETAQRQQDTQQTLMASSATFDAMLAVLKTATAAAIPTPTAAASATPQPTNEITPTATNVPAIALAGAGVSTNTQWKESPWWPYMVKFDGVEMVLVPAGCFDLGSKLDQSEDPPREHCFDKPFWIDMYEVTQAQFAGLGGVAQEASHFIGDARPRENVTWIEAATFCVKRGARLPTEPEWEYAARGPDDLKYTWGDNFASTYLVWVQNASGHTWDVGSRASVGGSGTLNASWVGAQDLLGNVAEWVSTWYASYPYTADDGREAQENVGRYPGRVYRGGSFLVGESQYLRASFRRSALPSYHFNYIGFRCVRPY